MDQLRVTKWQAEALLQISDLGDFVILNCTTSNVAHRSAAHGLYYALNFLSLKSAWTKRTSLPDKLGEADRFDFSAESEGAWQRLPSDIIAKLEELRPSAILKFGMGLLRIPASLPCPVLSYHHGDPRRFRGRPAGFYEMLNGERRLGQIVQLLSNRLDAGTVVAFAETRIQPHSYRSTMAGAFRYSPLLLRQAIRNALAGTILPIEPSGKNYRLPSNATVARFAARLIAAKVRRLRDLLFFEKRWEVATAGLSDAAPHVLLEDFPDSATWQPLQKPPTYRFIADPFPHPEGGYLVEALRGSDGTGEILHITASGSMALCTGSGHFSYPGTVCDGERWFLVPEIAGWSGPRAYELGPSGATDVGPLHVEGDPRIVDPTLHRGQDGRYYLFGSDPGGGANILRLWIAETLFGRFVEHPQSPVRISPNGARMGGALLQSEMGLFRIGQDCTRAYGDGVTLFEVTELSATTYSECELGDIRFTGVRGPHTINVSAGRIVFDFYKNRFSPLAGIRHLRWLAARKLAHRRP